MMLKYGMMIYFIIATVIWLLIGVALFFLALFNVAASYPGGFTKAQARSVERTSRVMILVVPMMLIVAWSLWFAGEQTVAMIWLGSPLGCCGTFIVLSVLTGIIRLWPFK